MTNSITSPATTSTDYDLMLPYWEKVETILDGQAAMRQAGPTYLPQFPNESNADHAYRIANARFTNVYADIVTTLAAKPFAKEVGLAQGASPRIEALVDDIDGRGNSLHVFAGETFFEGLNNAIDWILVDYARTTPGQTLADQRSSGARPYWVHIPAKRVLAVYTAVIDGAEQIVHFRMLETTTARDGFDEVTTNQVRIFDRAPIVREEDGQVIGYAPATFEVWEQQAATRRARSLQWVKVDEGSITLGVIPMVPFISGRRKGASWCFVPPMEGAADLQVELYQQETALKIAKETVAFPMLAGNGVTPPMKDGAPVAVPVGPKAVLYAPPFSDSGQHGEWKYITTDAAGLKFLADEVKATETQLRELGRQPLLASAGITVMSAAYAAQKATTLLQSWALGLQDALEQALYLTARWLGEAEGPAVEWNLDDLDLAMDDAVAPATLTTARQAGDLSQETYWGELKRRSILGPDFDPDEERQRLLDETPDPDADADREAALLEEEQAA
jgi:hypothetical protein